MDVTFIALIGSDEISSVKEVTSDASNFDRKGEGDERITLESYLFALRCCNL